MSITIRKWDKTKNGEDTQLFTMKCNGMEAVVSDFGAHLVQLIVPDKKGNATDVVLGFEHVADYENDGCFLGATVGRNANRIGHAQITINGKDYDLEKNDGDNNLHGGNPFYGNRVWKAEVKDEGEPSVIFSLESPHMDQGFPGNASIQVTYTLKSDHTIAISYHGTADQDTIFNMTNHSYFNMDGCMAGSVEEQEVWMDADSFTPVDGGLIPTGEIAPVEGTPMDFRTTKTIGKDLYADYEQLKIGGGFDHNWVLNHSKETVASMYSKKSGIKMEVMTDLPGVQLYTGNFVEGCGKGGNVYTKRGAACFETQYFPDNIHQSNFASSVVKAGEAYDTTTSYRFSVASDDAKVIMYGYQNCPDCVNAKNALDAAGVDYVYKDFAAFTGNLKEFLKIRDTSDLYKEFRGEAKLGIPVFVKADGSVTFDVEEVL